MNRINIGCVIITAAALVCWSVTESFSATWYVATNGNDAAAGTSWNVPFKTISNAYAKTSTAPAPAPMDTILVSNGEYVVTNILYFSTQVHIRGERDGVANPSGTIIKGNGAFLGQFMVCAWDNGRLVLEGVTLT